MTKHRRRPNPGPSEPPQSSHASSCASQKRRSSYRPNLDPPQSTVSQIGHPLPNSYALSRASQTRAPPAEFPVEQSSIMNISSKLSTSGTSGQPTNLFHSGELHKIGLQLASKMRRSEPKEKAKAKLQITAPVLVPEKASSSAPLSAPLRELEQRMYETKQNVKQFDQVDSGSLVNVVNQWENTVRRLAQSFEKAEDQRIVDLGVALDRDEEREQFYKQRLATQDADLASTVDQCMEKMKRYNAENVALRESLKTAQEQQVVIPKEVLEKAVAAKGETIKQHWNNKYKKTLAYELNKRDEYLKLRLEGQRDELTATFRTKTEAWKRDYTKLTSPEATPEYKDALAFELKKKDEETKQILERQKEEMQAEFEKNIKALKQKHEQTMSDYVATTTQNMSSSRRSSLDTQIDRVVSEYQVVPALPLQASVSVSVVDFGEQVQRAVPPTQDTPQGHRPSSPERKQNEDTNDKFIATDTVLPKHDCTADTNGSTTTATASLKRKRTVAGDDCNEDESADVSPKRPCTMLRPTIPGSKAPAPTLPAIQAHATTTSSVSEHAPTATPDLDPELDYELFGTTTTPQSEDSLTATPNFDPNLDYEPFDSPQPKKPRTSNPSAPPTSNVTKVGGLWSTTYHGLPQWKTTKASMTEDEIYELSPLYNPPPPPKTYGGPQWTTTEEEEIL